MSPITAVSDGQKTIRNAVAAVLPTIPHQLCHFHFLREAGKPIYEMDRHAKKELKKTVRDIRVLERQVENQEGPQAEAVMGYCQAVRSSLTDDGRPPLGDKGLLLHERLEKIAASIERVAQKRGVADELQRLRDVIVAGLEKTKDLWPEVREGFDLLKSMADVLRNDELLWGREVHQRFSVVVEGMNRASQEAHKRGAEKLSAALDHFVKASGSYEPGLFHCYDVLDLPATNNDLEQLFGRLRHHDRRTSGRKKGSASLVLRGSVRAIALLASGTKEITAEDLVPSNLQEWQKKREELQRRRRRRTQQMQFRRNPDAFLKQLEDLLTQATGQQTTNAKQTE